jgi:hypothetical protein
MPGLETFVAVNLVIPSLIFAMVINLDNIIYKISGNKKTPAGYQGFMR